MTVSLARVIVPASGDWSPVMSSSSVVLPAPFGPTIAKRRPALIISPTSLNRCCAAWLFDTPARVTRLMGLAWYRRGGFPTPGSPSGPVYKRLVQLIAGRAYQRLLTATALTG